MDPFAGGGSVAVAARKMGVPFFGMEIDPALACACIAKITDGPVAEGCLKVVGTIRDAMGRPFGHDEVAADQNRANPVVPGSRVLCADGTDPESWKRLDPPARGHAVIYTSPPFGVSSPRVVLPAVVRRDALKALDEGRVLLPSEPPAEFPDYLSIAMGALSLAVRGLESATLIVEHEPDDQGADSRRTLAESLETGLGRKVRDVRVLETRAFSRRGPFSLIVCEVA
ncbi:hypothetical protein [Actinocorallia longicatena]|uniref:DNA methylase n=1 Tax=Actinocorallia longicatena TaxID=111803 RepID=A0ABP6QAL3_9ACTN